MNRKSIAQLIMRLSIPGILLLVSCGGPKPTTDSALVATELGNLLIYPDIQRSVVHPNEPVVFEFIPTVENININTVRINPGEPGKPALGCGYNNLPCKGTTVRAEHKYAKGAYNVNLSR